MRSTDAGTAKAPLFHDSWPLWEQSRHFDLGFLLNCAVTDAINPAELGAVGLYHAGVWECKLPDEALTWSGGVYDLFGFPRGGSIARQDALACYPEHSRAKIERLRAHSIRRKRGFTVDLQINPVVGKCRSMRIIAAPIFNGQLVVGLHGVKILL